MNGGGIFPSGERNMKKIHNYLWKKIVAIPIVIILCSAGVSLFPSVPACDSPVANPGGPYRGCIDDVISFDGSGSYDPDGFIVSYEWDFGDGITGSGVAPSHTYADCGSFPVMLTVTDDSGLTATASSTVEILCKCDDSCNDISVNKTVWDGTSWVDDIRTVNGTKLTFKISITNNGGCPIDYLFIRDYLSTPQLIYCFESTPPSVLSSTEHVIEWFASLDPWQTIDIIYNASTVHPCYGWNSVYVFDWWGNVIGYDLTHVKVVSDPGQPALAISKMVWDASLNTWMDHTTIGENDKLTFKITISSSSLVTAHNVIITDVLPPLITFNFDATLTPDSAASNEVIWNLGDIPAGEEIEITYTATTVQLGTGYTTSNVTSTEGYSDEANVLLEIDSAPTILLFYPSGAEETLQDRAAIQWYAHDDKDGSNLPISLYFKNIDQIVWTEFRDNPYTNNGMLSWDTTSVADGYYQLMIVTQDSNHNVANVVSQQFQIENTETPSENLAPDTPGVPSGSSEDKPGLEYNYSATTIDPEDNQIYYLWDWGDGTSSDWLGPFNSGTTCEAKHSWNVKDTYSIKVKAKDIYGKESQWSNPLPITMPYFYNPILQFFEQLFERFPNLFPLLRQLFD
jgi:uncharacterized repeat protein (TIGR01451 family)